MTPSPKIDFHYLTTRVPAVQNDIHPVKGRRGLKHALDVVAPEEGDWVLGLKV